MVGELPSGFLEVGGSVSQNQEDLDHQTAQFLQAQQGGFSFMPANMQRLSVTIVQVNLQCSFTAIIWRDKLILPEHLVFYNIPKVPFPNIVPEITCYPILSCDAAMINP